MMKSFSGVKIFKQWQEERDNETKRNEKEIEKKNYAMNMVAIVY